MNTNIIFQLPVVFEECSIEQQKQMDQHPSSGFGTKDSSDSKSHDSGIDSIEKPGMSFGVLRFVG